MGGTKKKSEARIYLSLVHPAFNSFYGDTEDPINDCRLFSRCTLMEYFRRSITPSSLLIVPLLFYWKYHDKYLLNGPQNHDFLTQYFISSEIFILHHD